MRMKIKIKNSHYEVKNEITKQLLVVALIVAIAVWQHYFLIQAAIADIYIFMLLLVAGIYGIAHTVIGTHKLANEFVALHAMMEIYTDAVWMGRASQEAQAAKLARTKQPARVYKAPHSLATAHNLIVEEAQRNGHFRISAGTMQVLVADVETKIDDRQGMAHYLGALMVLLGLLGTFIGLMHTLESVGGILGSIDVSGAGGTNAIGKLIESLKRPLEGMSTGFGASLLGLVGSLIVGFLSRIDGVAASRLKHDFETWIRSTVQLEATNASPAVPAQATSPKPSAPMEEAAPRSLLKVARMTVSTMARLAEQTSALARAVEENRSELAQQRAGITALAQNMAASTMMQNRMLESVSTIGGSVSEMRNAFQAASRTLIQALDAQMNAQADASQALANQIRHLSEAQGATHAGLGAVDGKTDQLASRMEHLSQSVQHAIEGHANQTKAIEKDEIATLLADLDHLITASRLSPKDIAALRHLSAIMQESAGEGGAQGLQTALRQHFQAESTAADPPNEPHSPSLYGRLA
jgi:biopolymer transport protein ExbB/TolQ/predicted  nucleic acid-binding Zn-ribbon protein